jgi:hypothetical protein
MPPVGFKPTVSVGEQPETYAVDRAANGTGTKILKMLKKIIKIPGTRF